MPWSGMISIHALREEGDLYIPYYNAAGEISIHALREEGDTLTVSARIPSTYFYPRPPRGGRREKTGEFIEDKEFLSTPSARRATRQRGPCRHHRSISIHALREEGDAYEPDRQRPRADFYPRPPRGGRRHGPTTDISPVKYFYPRPPRGGRPRACAFRACVRIFLSTPSARRATIRTKSMLPV